MVNSYAVKEGINVVEDSDKGFLTQLHIYSNLF